MSLGTWDPKTNQVKLSEHLDPGQADVINEKITVCEKPSMLQKVKRWVAGCNFKQAA